MIYEWLLVGGYGEKDLRIEKIYMLRNYPEAH